MKTNEMRYTDEDKAALMEYLTSIRRRIKAIGISQTEFAQRVGVNQSYISKMLCGKVNISFGAAGRLARAAEMEFFPMLRRSKTRPEVTAPAVYALHPEGY